MEALGEESTFAASIMNDWDAKKADTAKDELMSLPRGVLPPVISGSIYHGEGRR